MSFLWEDDPRAETRSQGQQVGFFSGLCQPWSEACEPRRAASHGGPSLVQMCWGHGPSQQPQMVARPRGITAENPLARPSPCATSPTAPSPRWSPSATSPPLQRRSPPQRRSPSAAPSAAGGASMFQDQSSSPQSRAIGHSRVPPIVEWPGAGQTRPTVEWPGIVQTSGRAVDDGRRTHTNPVTLLPKGSVSLECSIATYIFTRYPADDPGCMCGHLQSQVEDTQKRQQPGQ